MSDDSVWIPCGLCRSGNYRVQLGHWREFQTARALELHLKEHLMRDDIEKGTIESAIDQWRTCHLFDEIEQGACRDPRRSVTELFEQEKKRKTRASQ